LSYSKFEYAKPVLSSSAINKNESIEISVEVKNASAIDGEEVVQLYIRDEYASVARPVKELKDFKRIALKAGEAKKVSFIITPDMLSFLDIDMNPTIEKGTFIAMIGSSSRNKDLKKIEFEVK
jgi:beta-glucosidase